MSSHHRAEHDVTRSRSTLPSRLAVGFPRHFIGAICGMVMILGIGQVAAAQRPSPERWKRKIQEFLDADARQLPPTEGVVFVGSSSIRLWDLEKSFPTLPVVNRGFGGSIIADSIHYAEPLIIKHRPRLVVLYAGDNDVAGGLTPAQVTADFCRFVACLRRDLPQTRIAFVAIKPSRARWELVAKMRAANEAIREFCDSSSALSFIDVDTPMIDSDGLPRGELFRADGLHLSDAGYAIWTSLVMPHVTAALQ